MAVDVLVLGCRDIIKEDVHDDVIVVHDPSLVISLTKYIKRERELQPDVLALLGEQSFDKELPEAEGTCVVTDFGEEGLGVLLIV